MKIPTIIKTYPKNEEPPIHEFSANPYEYFLTEDEKINVVLWVRYPSYDFIFGLPDESSPAREKEFGFFQFRKQDENGNQKGWAVYLDQTELEEMVKGFQNVLKASKNERKEEWENRKYEE